MRDPVSTTKEQLLSMNVFVAVAVAVVGQLSHLMDEQIIHHMEQPMIHGMKPQLSSAQTTMIHDLEIK